MPDYIDNPLVTGEIVPIIHTLEGTFWEQGNQLIEQREGGGRMKYRRLGDDGEPIEGWQDAPPQPGRSASN